MQRISELERKYVLEALDNGFRTSLNSVFNNRMERKFAEILNVKYAIGHVNGTATMHTALAALGVKPGDEVIVPPLTMLSTTLAVLHNNSIPVFADVDPDTFNIYPQSIRKKITAKTKAIISVSLFGLVADYDELLKICNQHNLFLIEDNAQCLLGQYKGEMAGQFGSFASYSFQASKHITCGEGGMLTTNDKTLADKARRFSSLGYASVGASEGKISRDEIQDPKYDRHLSLGFNYRMSEVNAAVTLGQLERVYELVENRIKAAKLFDEAVGDTDLLKKQTVPDGCKHTYWSYGLVLKTDNPGVDWYRFRELFKKNGGDNYYSAWKLSYMEPLLRNEIQTMPGIWQRYSAGLCPNAEYLQPRMIQLKTNYWDLSEAERQAQVLQETIREFQR